MKKTWADYSLPVITITIIIICLVSGIRPMIVMSGSMEPEIRTGSLCFVNVKYPIKKIKKDHIITYKIPGIKVTHRVLNVTEEGIVTKGDANKTEDIGIVNRGNYIGKYIFSIPVAGYVLFYLKKYLFQVVFLLPVIYLIYFNCRKQGCVN